MFKRKTKKQTNWWQTSDWKDKIEDGRVQYISAPYIIP